MEEEKRMTYQEAMDYIEEVKREERNKKELSHSNIESLCEKLGHPQRELSFIYIMGENGKSSVLAFVSEVLKAAGYRIGGYRSPAVFDQRDKIRMNGRPISKKEFCGQITRLRALGQELAWEGKSYPTFHELEMAMAFQHFKEQGCQIVVWEIDFDEWEAMAGLTPNIWMNVLTSTSLEQRERMKDFKIPFTESPFIKSDTFKVSGVRRNLERQIFSYQEYKNLTIPLLGAYQIENGVLALQVIKQLKEMGFSISEKAVYKGFAEVSLPGRFQILAKKPYFIVDGAKDAEGVQKLAETIQFYFTGKKVIYIMGMLQDVENCPLKIYSLAEQILTIPTRGENGLSSYELACIMRDYHESVTAVDSMEEAVELACLLADKETVIVAFGSLSGMGSLIQFVEKVSENEERNNIGKDSHGKKRDNYKI
ncbi:hypothetical protein D5281_03800 [bacterium 1xD42-62]|uniref:tetrahydrofolate synthase n=1 Tax=Parablautia muri TaxID=2320879 RepID=A0A9X5GS52_9FIRM|nr:hypothetical protein [Parablautia muri]